MNYFSELNMFSFLEIMSNITSSLLQISVDHKSIHSPGQTLQSSMDSFEEQRFETVSVVLRPANLLKVN